MAPSSSLLEQLNFKWYHTTRLFSRFGLLDRHAHQRLSPVRRNNLTWQSLRPTRHTFFFIDKYVIFGQFRTARISLINIILWAYRSMGTKISQKSRSLKAISLKPSEELFMPRSGHSHVKGGTYDRSPN